MPFLLSPPKSPPAQISADKVAEVLSKIETAPVAGFSLTPIAVRHMGWGPAEAYVVLRLDGRRHGLSLAETNLLTRRLRDQKAFVGASLLARMIEDAAAQAWRLLASASSYSGHVGTRSEPAA